MIDWISVAERLPAEGQWVLVYLPNMPWTANGLIKAYVCEFASVTPRGNNHRPYEWRSFGPAKFFGQDVSHWAELNKPDHEGQHKNGGDEYGR